MSIFRPEPDGPGYEEWLERRIDHLFRQHDAWCVRTERLAHIASKRTRRKHRAAFRRRKAGIA